MSGFIQSRNEEYMNQQPPKGNMPVPSSPNNMPQGQYPQGYPQQPPYNGQQPNGPQPMNGQQPYGRQWNAAPNFNPNQNTQQPQNNNKKQKKKGSGSIVGWIFLGIVLMFALAIGGGFIGYNTAINARQSEYKRKSMMAAAEQYAMAISDIEKGNYSNAKTRLDYVIEVDRNYPGAMDTYQQVMLALYPTASPTPMITATPMPTPTQDTRGEEEMFQNIQQLIYAQNWESAISVINALRNKNINYRGLEVDGMYYIALRNYGIYQINSGYLEQGIYNITLAEALGPIDKDADSMRNAARSYLSGAGFWEINWSKALEYYSNAAQVLPNMYDRATMYTANQRYALASFNVANEYVAREDFCGAIPFYEQGMPIAGDENIQMTATAVYLVCYPPVEEVVEESHEIPNESNEEHNEENYIPPEEDFYMAE